MAKVIYATERQASPQTYQAPWKSFAHVCLTPKQTLLAARSRERALAGSPPDFAEGPVRCNPPPR